MPVELRVPKVGESITEVQVGDWLKQEGELAGRDEPVVVIETDKATVELPAPVRGRVTRVLKRKGERAEVGEVIGFMEEGAGAAAGDAAGAPVAGAAPAAAGAGAGTGTARVMPAARQALADHGLRSEQVEGTGPRGHVTKADVLRAAARQEDAPAGAGAASGPVGAAAGGSGSGPAGTTGGGPGGRSDPAAIEKTAVSKVASPAGGNAPAIDGCGTRHEETVPMTFLRQRVAVRLKQAQNTAALTTTFNEIDMTGVMGLRQKHQEAFQKRYGVKLGFMSFFVKAAVDALKTAPEMNAKIDGTNIVYRQYCDIGVAVGGGRGLVVPVLRNAERMSFAEVEKAIADFGKRAQQNTLKLEELQGGTFTISNGGIYGSLLSTPIVNPPQSGILGMHAIQDRPVARDGQVVIRPMMYVALTYDHRMVDGREAVTFLRRIKEAIEEPARLLIEV